MGKDSEITIKDRDVVKARIGELNAHKEKASTLGSTAKSRVTALTSALGVTADGSAPAEAVPGNGATTAQGHTDAATGKLGGASDKLQGWLDGLTTIQQEGATAVQQADGSSTSKPETANQETPKPTPAPAPTPPQATPYSTSGGTTGGVSPYPAAG